MLSEIHDSKMIKTYKPFTNINHVAYVYVYLTIPIYHLTYVNHWANRWVLVLMDDLGVPLF